MIISSILSREKLNLKDQIKVLWTPINHQFENFISSLNCKILHPNQIYYGDNAIDIIICNNKVEQYQYCYNLSRNLHLPVLLIDHMEKNPMYDPEKVRMLNNFPCYHHICISKKISDSWDLKNTQILSYNINEKDNIFIWNNLIFQTAKKMFKI